MPNPAIAAYEAAYDVLQEPSAFAATSSLPHLPPVLFRLAGVDEPVSWPLSNAQAAQIAALYPNKLISAANIHLNERYADNYNRMLDEVSDACLPHLVPSHDTSMELSHMVVDDVGDADLFRLQPSNDDVVNATTFGVLIVLLPSAHTGGVLTFTYGNHSKTFDDDESLVETPLAAAFLTTTISSAPITAGRHMALVYRLYYGHVDGPMRMKPNVQDAAVAAFRAVGQSTTQEGHRLGLELEVPRQYTLNLDELTLWQKGILYTFGKSYIVEILPLCDIPELVLDGVLGQMPHGFLQMPPLTSNAFECPSFALVFWPKHYRVCWVDIDGALDVVMLRLERGDDRDDGYLGLFDTRELVLGAMPYFGVTRSSLVKAKSCELAPVVHALLTKHGWEPLQASMLRLVQRWVQTHPISTLQLLTSLVGLDTESCVCLPLRQPFEAELFKRCYDVVLSTPDLFIEEVGEEDCGWKVVKGLFLLEHYVKKMAPQLQNANYASQRLPLSLVPAIDGFLFAHPSVESVLWSSAELCQEYAWLYPLDDIGVGLASAVRCQPLLSLPPTVIDMVLAAMRKPRSVCHMANMAGRQADIAPAVLVAASLSQRLDAALFARFVDIYGLQLLPIVASIASQLPNDAILCPLVVTYIDSSVDTLVDESKWPEPLRMWIDSIDLKVTSKYHVNAVVHALQLLQRYAPRTVLGYATRWLALLPTTLGTIHDRLLPILSRLDRSSCVYSLLATAIVDRFATVPVPLPPPTLDPQHCVQCSVAHLFVTIVQERDMTWYTGTDRVCTSLVRAVEADATRLRITQSQAQSTHASGAHYRLQKVPQHGQISEPEWYDRKKQMRQYATVKAVVETLSSQCGDATSEEPAAPAAKRARRSQVVHLPFDAIDNEIY
ncbi:hypothetical protein SPRG_16680 [Saprolegnia parasitica CBS 223.65]|uniref:Uncharacterized protein n=1 Tax=Saprolegnia parasitica (strain CBS 223.65) TaxID=695850 RepID=A0A067BUF2_SAPPC|nr:hypothetical protein SPRG_16680 [Saprolegnia parasitica CBS 223.65]KDO17921.1 hypothetical protein SPRG_16680 [Saprolegnia parasitica CBS 223.65]|eukprot:XP_012211372.1 hypothetical protein SPRG_16680 [Saprolegnia parasitica CBS 223.65]